MARHVLVVSVVLLATAPLQAGEIRAGTYEVRGHDADGTAYTGEVKLLTRTGGFSIAGEIRRDPPASPESFQADASIVGGKLTFAVPRGRGIAERLATPASAAETWRASYEVLGAKLSGSWTGSDGATIRAETWTLGEPRVSGVLPRTLEAGTWRQTLVVHGENLPLPREIEPSRILWTFDDGTVDPKVRTASIGERASDGARLEVVIDVLPGARVAPRGIQLLGASKASVVDVVVGDPDLPLGGSVALEAGQRARLYVPLDDCQVRLDASGGPVRLLDPSGSPVALDANGGAVLARGGVYRVEKGGASGKVSSRCTVVGQVAPERQPWNFWYFPFYDGWFFKVLGFVHHDGKTSLYADGGAFEKLDAVFGLAPTDEEPFDPARHLDAPRFKLPDSPEERARYNPTTVRGYAYCYQRSTRFQDVWMGSCLGACIAGTLHEVPRARTVALPPGTRYHGKDHVTFSVEELKGILSAYYTADRDDLRADAYLEGCPPGPLSASVTEPADSFASNLWLGLVEVVKGKGEPLEADLRARTHDAGKGLQKWNGLIWRFEAQLERAPGQLDPECIQISVRVFSTNDVFPSGDDRGPRCETYVIRLRTKNGAVVSGASDQKWVSATHLCPEFLAHIKGVVDPDAACANKVLGRKIGIARLVDKLGYEHRQPR
jgi:hypothetical protein